MENILSELIIVFLIILGIVCGMISVLLLVFALKKREYMRRTDWIDDALKPLFYKSSKSDVEILQQIIHEQNCKIHDLRDENLQLFLKLKDKSSEKAGESNDNKYDS